MFESAKLIILSDILRKKTDKICWCQILLLILHSNNENIDNLGIHCLAWTQTPVQPIGGNPDAGC